MNAQVRDTSFDIFLNWFLKGETSIATTVTSDTSVTL